jgi:inner membrane protein
MSDASMTQSGLQARLKSRSMGMKMIVVCGLALVMTIPSLLRDRVGGRKDHSSRGCHVQEISSHVGGQQTFLGPTLAIPYTIPPQSTRDISKHGIYLVFPERATSTVKTATEERHRSLFKVPVFQADLRFDATFNLSGVPSAAPIGAELDWSRAEIVVGVSDARGALADALLTRTERP